MRGSSADISRKQKKKRRKKKNVQEERRSLGKRKKEKGRSAKITSKKCTEIKPIFNLTYRHIKSNLQ